MALLAISAVRILSCKTVTDNGRRFHYESLSSLRVTFLDCVSVTSWALVYAVISFEVRSLILGVGVFSVNIFTTLAAKFAILHYPKAKIAYDNIVQIYALSIQNTQ